MKRTLLLLLSYCLGIALLAQPGPFEQQQVLFADGEEELLWISLDEKTDLLHTKTSEDAPVEVYQADDILSFSYQDIVYYALTLRPGYFTFFQVHHEGGQFAVLEKKPNFKALSIVVEESRGEFFICQDRKDNEFTLCYQDVQQRPTFNAVGVPIGGAPVVSVHQFEVKKLIYLAVEGKLSLFYLETDERFNFWDNLFDSRPGNRKVENMLEDFIEDKRKIDAIQQKVKQDRLDIRNTDHLIIALGAAYH